MNAADWIAVLVIAFTALGGFRRGFVGGALALAGLVSGVIGGANLAPVLVGDGSAVVPLVALGGAAIGGSVGHALGGLAGRSVRGTIAPVPAARMLDSAAGTALGIALGLAVCWAVGAVLLYTPGHSDLRRLAQGSLVLSTLTEAVPPEHVMDEVGRIDPFASIVGPVADVDAPEPAIARDPQVRAARASVVRVRGIACGLGVEGSGWIIRPGVVITNAHVVAGVKAPLVDGRDGRARRSLVVSFDARKDVAVLRVPGLKGRTLRLAAAKSGKPAALLGFPQNGPYRVTPVRLGNTVTATTSDAYGRVVSGLRIVTLRGVVRGGNSGGPIVGGDGRVVATVFARRRGSDHGYAVPNAYVRRALANVGRPLETSCVAH